MYQDISEEEYRKLSTEEKIKHLKKYHDYKKFRHSNIEDDNSSKNDFEFIDEKGNSYTEKNSILNDEFTKNIYKIYNLKTEHTNADFQDQYVEDFDIINKKYNNVLHISIISFLKTETGIYNAGIINKIKLKNFNDMNIMPTIILFNLTKENLIKKLDEIVVLLKNNPKIDTIILSTFTHSTYSRHNRFRALNILDKRIEVGEILMKFKFIKNILCVFDGCYSINNSITIIDKSIFKKDQHIIIINSSEMGYLSIIDKYQGSFLVHSLLYSLYNLNLYYKDKSSIVINDIITLLNQTMMKYHEILENKKINYKPSLMISKNIDEYLKNIDYIKLHFYCNQTNYYIDEINEKIKKNKKILDTEINRDDFKLKIDELQKKIEKNKELLNIIKNDKAFKQYDKYFKYSEIVKKYLDNYPSILEDIKKKLKEIEEYPFDMIRLLIKLKLKLKFNTDSNPKSEYELYIKQLDLYLDLDIDDFDENDFGGNEDNKELDKIINDLILLNPDISQKKLTNIDYIDLLINNYSSILKLQYLIKYLENILYSREKQSVIIKTKQKICQIDTNINEKKLDDNENIKTLINKYTKEYNKDIYKHIKHKNEELNKLYYYIDKLYAIWVDINDIKPFLSEYTCIHKVNDKYQLYDLYNWIKRKIANDYDDISDKVKIGVQYEEEIEKDQKELISLYKKFKGGFSD